MRFLKRLLGVGVKFPAKCRSGLLLEVMWVHDGVMDMVPMPGFRFVVKSVERHDQSGRAKLNVMLVERHSLEPGFTGKAKTISLGSRAAEGG